MSFIPMDFRLSLEEMYRNFNKTALDIISGIASLPISYFDLEISGDCFKEMEITPSPQMTAGYKILLADLVEKYNPFASIRESSLLGLI